MKQRIKLAFKILFCKSYLFTDFENSWADKITINDCIGVLLTVSAIVEEQKQQSILNEAKQILCQKQ